MQSVRCSDYDSIYDSSRRPEAKPELALPIYETAEDRALFEKTLAAIRKIMGGLEEISSKRLTDELARIEGGPWAEWDTGAGRRNRSRSAR